MDKKEKFKIPDEGVATVKNQHIKDVQRGVIEDKDHLSNNIAVNKFNNQKR